MTLGKKNGRVIFYVLLAALFLAASPLNAFSEDTGASVYNFGQVPVGGGKSVDFNITNNNPSNTITVTLTLPYGSACGFSINTDKVSIPGGGTVPVRVTFSPASAEECQGLLKAVSGWTVLRKITFNGTGVEAPKNVVIGQCDTGIADRNTAGGKLSARVQACVGSAKNHGQLVSCISTLANDLKNQGVLSGAESNALKNCASQSK